MKNAVHLPLGSEEGGNVSENEGQTPPKRGRRPGTRDHDESKITHGPGVCPHCEKVRILFLNKIEIRVHNVEFKYQSNPNLLHFSTAKSEGIKLIFSKSCKTSTNYLTGSTYSP